MRDIQKYLIDYEKLKVGDKVWSIQLGDCKMIGIGINAKLERRVVCENINGLEVSYTSTGYQTEKDAFPSLFKSNPFSSDDDAHSGLKKAHAKGAIIQSKHWMKTDGWIDDPNPEWLDWPVTYRIKPDDTESDKPESILQEAERIVIGDRDKDYGSVHENFGRIAKMWSALTGIEINSRMVGRMMIALKLSRDVHNPKRDNLTDSAGYAYSISLLEKEGLK